MNDILIYMMKSIAISVMLFGFYWVYLRKQLHFKLNRFFLLGTIMMTAFLPLVGIQMSHNSAVSNSMFIIPVIELQPILVEEPQQSAIDQFLSITNIAILLYILIAILQFILLFINFIKIRKIRFQAHKLIYKEKTIYLSQTIQGAFSFGSRIFIPQQYAKNADFEWIAAHEQAHVDQFHTIDILLFEIIRRVLWFNPLLIIIGKNLRREHEFLADQTVIQNGIRTEDYQKLLYNELTGKFKYIITNNFNFNIKTRIIMLSKTHKKRNIALTLILTGLIIFSGVVLGALPHQLRQIFEGNNFTLIPENENPEFSLPLPSKDQNEVQNTDLLQRTVAKPDTMIIRNSDTVYLIENPEDAPEYPGGNEALMEFIRTNIHYPEKAKSEGKQGTVYISFYIEADGLVTDIKILRGISPEIDEEAIRVVKLMPNWKPGLYNGEPIRTKFNLPIKFALGDKK